MAPKLAISRDESRSDHALAHAVMFHLKRSLREEQHSVGKSRVDLGPWSMGVWSTWDALSSIPHLRISTGFPATTSFLHSLKLQTVQMIGACCLEERGILHQQLTVSERQVASDVRGVIIEELNGFPCWIEARKDLLSPGLRMVLERFLNAILECHYTRCSTSCRIQSSAPLRIGSLRPAFAVSFGVQSTAQWSHRLLLLALRLGPVDRHIQHRHLVLVLLMTPTSIRTCWELRPSRNLRLHTWLGLLLWVSMQVQPPVKLLMGMARMTRAETWALDFSTRLRCICSSAWMVLAMDGPITQLAYVGCIGFARFYSSTWPQLPRRFRSYESWKKLCSLLRLIVSVLNSTKVWAQRLSFFIGVFQVCLCFLLWSCFFPGFPWSTTSVAKHIWLSVDYFSNFLSLKCTMIRRIHFMTWVVNASHVVPEGGTSTSMNLIHHSFSLKMSHQFWNALRAADLGHLAPTLVSHGITTLAQLVASTVVDNEEVIAKWQVEAILSATHEDVQSSPSDRRDLPVAYSGRRANFSLAVAAGQPNNRKRSLEQLDADVLARSTNPANEARLRTYLALCAVWEVSPWPLTIENTRAFGASLKMGGYRSATVYFQSICSFQQRVLHTPVPQMVRYCIKIALGPSNVV